MSTPSKPSKTDITGWRQRTTITVDQAAAVLGVGRSAAFNAVNRGELPCVRVGHRMVIPVHALETLLNLPPVHQDASASV